MPKMEKKLKGSLDWRCLRVYACQWGVVAGRRKCKHRGKDISLGWGYGKVRKREGRMEEARWDGDVMTTFSRAHVGCMVQYYLFFFSWTVCLNLEQ
jgi:hypothetical protein